MKIKRERALTYAFMFVLLGIIILGLYFVNVKLTGQVVFDQQNQVDFDGVYENVFYDTNSSTIILEENETQGTYTSGIFDGSEDVVWNNLTWEGEGIIFEVRTCSSENCSSESFVSSDLNALNLTGRYFQYKAFFNEDPNITISLARVVIDYSDSGSETISVTITEPTGTKTSQTGIPITFTTTGENLTCWYNIDNGANVTLTDCVNSNFDVSADGNYVFNIYVNNSLGEEFSDGSSFFVTECVSNSDCASGYECNSNQVCVVEPSDDEENTTTEVPVEILQNNFILSAGEIQPLSISQGGSKEVKWLVTNAGTSALSECQVNDLVKDSRISFSDESFSLSPGEQKEFVFDVTIPEETEEGDYVLRVFLKCYETFSMKDFNVNVFKKKIGFELIDAQRTRKDRVRVFYNLEELSGDDQDVEIGFFLLNQDGQEVSEVKENKTLSGNSTKEFRTNLEINESLMPVNESTNEPIESNLTLVVDLNSEIYSSSVQEKITLGAPIGGFAVFGGIGTGGIIAIIVILISGIAFFVVRKIRKNKTK